MAATTTGTITIAEILTYHNMERVVFERVLRLGRSREVARNATVLWMWLERVGFHDMVQTARDSPDSVLLRLVREAEAVLDVLHQDSPPPADNPRAIPLTASRVHQPVSLRWFYFCRDVAIQGMAVIAGGVGRVIFDDALCCLKREDPRLGRMFEKGPEPLPEHVRTMFLMFDRGRPVGRDRVVEHFTSRWGDCIERVMIEPTAGGAAPMYGRLVFRDATYLELALNRRQQTEFVIDGRQIWGLRPMVANDGHGRR